MKQAAMIGAVLVIATWSFAQSNSKPTTQSQPPAQSTAPATAASPKRPPQAKTQPEYEAYKTAVALTDAAAAEKAADDFAAKFPDSELRVMLYKSAMRLYQRAGNSDKIIEMGRKGLALDGDDPELLVTVASELAEKTHDTDLDKDQRLADARKGAERALVTVDTDIPTGGYPEEQLKNYKNFIRSQAYFVIGTAAFKASNWPEAETNLKKSIDALPQSPDVIAVYRLALSLDFQNKIPEALKAAQQAVDLTKDAPDSPAGKAARQEQDRLMKYSTTGTSGQAGTPPKN